MSFNFFGELIYEKRKSQYTATELAEKTKIPKSDISKIENNKRSKIKREDVKNLCNVLEIELSECKEFFINFDTDDEYLIIHHSRRNLYGVLEEQNNLKKQMIAKLLPSLIDEGWGIEIPRRSDLGDIIVTKSQQKWHIKLWTINRETYTQNDLRRSHFQTLRNLKYLLGSIAIYKSEITKFSLVILDEKLFDEFKIIEPINLSIETSFIYLNLENSKYYEVDSKMGKCIKKSLD